jgi:hypothetical protein
MGSLEERKVNNGVVNDGMTDVPVANWLQNEAKQKLYEAFQRLNLDNQKINGKHLVNLSLEDLL